MATSVPNLDSLFPVSDYQKKKLKEAFGGSRYITMDKAGSFRPCKYGSGDRFSGFYLVKSRYIWPVPGKYNIYLHGGVSLMECFVPVIEVEK